MAEVRPVSSSRRQTLVWVLVLLVLSALGAWLLRPPPASDTEGLLRRLCRNLDSLRESEVAVGCTWTHGGRVGREHLWSLRFSEGSAPPRLEAWNNTTGLHLTAEGDRGVVESPGRLVWTPPSPPSCFRDLTGGFLGVPKVSHPAHPAGRDGAIPYALGPLVRLDSYGYFMVGVRSEEWLGCEGGIHHLAFHQDGLDWELWMDDGIRPLPRRIRMQWRDLADGRPGRVLDIRYTWKKAE